jgi:hypothetical protein
MIKENFNSFKEDLKSFLMKHFFHPVDELHFIFLWLYMVYDADTTCVSSYVLYCCSLTYNIYDILKCSNWLDQAGVLPNMDFWNKINWNEEGSSSHSSRNVLMNSLWH